MSATNDNLIRDLYNDPNYYVSDDGVLLTKTPKSGRVSPGKVRPPLADWRVQVPRPDSHGYLRYIYKKKYLYAHRLFYYAFNGELDASKQINHKDGNRKNNSPENLELVTCSENMKHAYQVLKRKPGGPVPKNARPKLAEGGQ